MRALAVLVLSFSVAQAQPVDKEAVRAELKRRGYTCEQLRAAPKAKLIIWALSEGISAEQGRQVKITCNIK